MSEQHAPPTAVARIDRHIGAHARAQQWIAGLYVEPAFRGRGYATALIRRVEAFAQAASVRVLWLYTSTAETLYARLGWQRAGTEDERGETVVLMKRSLPG